MRQLFRTVAILEALSFLLLLGVAMPMKYFYDMPAATKVPGMIHGLLFLAYIAIAHKIADDESWPGKKLFLAYVASILPLGTLIFDRKFMQSKNGSLHADAGVRPAART